MPISLKQRFKLVDVLLGCACMQTLQSRDQIVKDLSPDIRDKIVRGRNNRDDVDNIVSTCLEDEGIEQLLAIVEWKERPTSRAWQQVAPIARDILSASVSQHAPQSGPPKTISSQHRYAVFLSHNSADKVQVEWLAVKLEEQAGLPPFLDKWHLTLGDAWQEGLEEALDNSATCAVFLGPNGVGSWQNEEMRAALVKRVNERSFRVIPVLLPGADPKDKSSIPGALKALNWADFRNGLDNEAEFHRLVAGIRGEQPGRAQS